jgi:hypothetical protein
MAYRRTLGVPFGINVESVSIRRVEIEAAVRSRKSFERNSGANSRRCSHRRGDRTSFQTCRRISYVVGAIALGAVGRIGCGEELVEVFEFRLGRR